MEINLIKVEKVRKRRDDGRWEVKLLTDITYLYHITFVVSGILVLLAAC